jgi:hypothetical protein
MWLFGRRKPAKRKGRSSTVADGDRPGAASVLAFANNDVLRSSPIRRNSRRRRKSAPSNASTRDPEPDLSTRLPIYAANARFADGQLRDAALMTNELANSRRMAQSPHLRSVSQHQGNPFSFPSNAHSGLSTVRERGRLQRPQSLRKPVDESALPRRKSTKKQKREQDHQREAEIKTMNLPPLPQKRPAGNSWGMLRRDSKKVKGPPHHRSERPSDDSFPMDDSMHSSISANSDHRAFRVSALDMFSPRPTLRCSVRTQQYYSGTDTSPTSNKSKNDSHMSKRRKSISREGYNNKRTSRIDDLADTLDAGALREILERDKRRRDKKMLADEDRLRRRLERRAEKQRAAEAGRSPSTPPMKAREPVGLGIQKEAASPIGNAAPSTPVKPQVQTSSPAQKVEENTRLPTPIESPVEEPVVSDAQHAIRYSRGSVSGPSHARIPSNVSHLPELLSKRMAEESPTTIEHAYDPTTSGSLHAVDSIDTITTKKGTERRRSSEGRRMSYFASFFRRGKRSSQAEGRTTPSEVSFSNTSRESMSRQPLPAHLVATAPTAPIQFKRAAGAPRRTMSKFREDLPEFPLSPPDSRLNSPEKTTGSAYARIRQTRQTAKLPLESASSSSEARTDSPVSPGLPKTGLMSQSLASVDSEGSWLSGKPIKRASNRSHIRSSVGSSPVVKRPEAFNASYEELGIPDDEYFNRLTPRPDPHRRSANSADVLPEEESNAAQEGAESDDEQEPSTTAGAPEEEEFVQSSIGRKPTVIYRQNRVKSTEGLLSFFQDDSTDAAPGAERAENDSPTSEGEPMVFERAKSVDLGKHHVRQLSAGSARLLSIGKRTSATSQNKSQQV